ncbi:hypothetical protein R3P38DRAFT_3102382 [Favolaschia claudopus]|uniref:Secreted protein n=1 Tax=Favolaschia claudopus TaxID=2862362 RepID=A0AAV9ZL38_9AGAR
MRFVSSWLLILVTLEWNISADTMLNSHGPLSSCRFSMSHRNQQIAECAPDPSSTSRGFSLTSSHQVVHRRAFPNPKSSAFREE